VRDSEIAILDLDLGMRLAAQLAHGLEHLGEAAAIAGWLLQRPPPSVLKGSLPWPAIRLPSDTNAPPFPFSQKPRSSSCISTVMVKLS